ncbi:MAG TPA: sugar phosphate isomerase/epimerase [Syntrophorhabdaceae bacterium]
MPTSLRHESGKSAKVKILFSTGCLYYLPIRDIFTIAGEAGFEGCDLVIDSRFNDPRFIDKVRECLDILPVYSVHAPFAKMRSWGSSQEILSRTLEIGSILGAGVVNFHPPSWYSMEMKFFRWFKKVKDFQEEFECRGCSLAVENMPLLGKRLMLAPYVLNAYEDLISFGMERNLYFTFDTTHLGTFGGDVVAAFLKFFSTGRLKNIHISDYGGYKSHLFLGRGDLPVAKLLNTARRLGYDEYVTLELAPHELPKTRPWLVKMLEYQASLLKLHLGVSRNG